MRLLFACKSEKITSNNNRRSRCYQHPTALHLCGGAAQLSDSSVPYGYCQCGCGEKALVPSKNNKSKGWVKGCPMPFYGRHSRRKPGPRYIEEDRGYTTPCLIFQGYIDASGYGSDWVNGKSQHAHRAAWIRTNGPIPDGLFVLHRCDVKACTDLGHLFLGTQADNIADKVSKGRQARGASHGSRTKPHRIARGERNGIAKLNDEKARQIKLLVARGELNFTEIGALFDISRYTIALIARGKRWTHVKLDQEEWREAS